MPLGDTTQGVDGVDKQIEHHLLHLDAITPHRWQGRGQVRLQYYAMALDVVAHQGEHLQDQGVDIKRFRLRRCLLHEGAYPPDDITGPIPVADHTLYGRARGADRGPSPGR